MHDWALGPGHSKQRNKGHISGKLVWLQEIVVLGFDVSLSSQFRTSMYCICNMDPESNSIKLGHFTKSKVEAFKQ